MSSSVLFDGEIVEVDIEGRAISVDEDEEKEIISAKYLASVDHVKVIPPPHRQDQLCSIYGTVSVTDDPTEPSSVTLFDRSRDNPETITLGDPNYTFLSLISDSSDRDLSGLRPMFFTIKLFEMQQSSSGDEEEQEHELFAYVKHFPHKGLLADEAFTFQIGSVSGFHIEVSYAIIIGARVQVDVRINPLPIVATEAADSKKRKNRAINSIYGIIGASQNLEGGCRTGMTLYCKDRDEATECVPIPLHRNIVAAPIATCGLLAIDLLLYNPETESCIVHEFIPFPIMPTTSTSESFITNKHRTHTKHILDDLVSVSIKFIVD